MSSHDINACIVHYMQCHGREAATLLGTTSPGGRMATSAALLVRSVRLQSCENSSAAWSQVWSPEDESPLPVRTITVAAPENHT